MWYVSQHLNGLVRGLLLRMDLELVERAGHQQAIRSDFLNGMETVVEEFWTNLSPPVYHLAPPPHTPNNNQQLLHLHQPLQTTVAKKVSLSLAFLCTPGGAHETGARVLSSSYVRVHTA